MNAEVQNTRSSRGTLLRVIAIGFASAILLIAGGSLSHAQTYTVLHAFTGGPDGGAPLSGLTIDVAGNLYGTTCGSPCNSGASNQGTVFRLSQKGSGWVLNTLYTFHGGNDGAGPTSRVIIGPDGALYGTTYYGGGSGCGGTGCGTVFKLRPPASATASAIGGWTETVLHSFQGTLDGANPYLGDVVFDPAGNLYSTTFYGGPNNAGTVFQLTPSGGSWTENVIYAFTGGWDGAQPSGTMELFTYENTVWMEGTAEYGGNGGGTLFQLSSSGSGWTESTVYAFQGLSDGYYPIGGPSGGDVITSSEGGTNNEGGAVFVYNSQDLFHYDFGFGTGGPWSTLTYANGTLFGTTYADGADNSGTIFYLYGCAGWDEGTIYTFTGQQDGGLPIGTMAASGSSNPTLYGTAWWGGAYGYGVVFAATPQSSLRESSQCSRNDGRL